MTKQVPFYLTEIRPEDFSDEGSVRVAANPKRFKVSSACPTGNANDAEIWSCIQALSSALDQKTALQGLLYFVKVAQSGPPFTASFDKKTMHETHEYISAVTGRLEKIWRYRRGDIRLLFVYAEDRVVLLCDALAKRKDQLSQAEKLAAERAVDAFLRAQQNHSLTWV
jgi:hypothetical protein